MKRNKTQSGMKEIESKLECKGMKIRNGQQNE